MEQVGHGDYAIRVSDPLTPELARLRDSFNRMAARLAATNADNRRLNEQLLTLQEEERNEIARDLHDEVGPFLFAINVDASQHGATCLARDARRNWRRILQSIAEAARHLQRRSARYARVACGRSLRSKFGLAEAVGRLVDLWRRRLLEIEYRVSVAPDCEGLERLKSRDDRVTGSCRECLSNAVRHGELDDRSRSRSSATGSAKQVHCRRGRRTMGRMSMTQPADGIWADRHGRARQGDGAGSLDLRELARRRLSWSARCCRARRRERTACPSLLTRGRAVKLLIVDDHPDRPRRIAALYLRPSLAAGDRGGRRRPGGGQHISGTADPTSAILDLNLPPGHRRPRGARSVAGSRTRACASWLSACTTIRSMSLPRPRGGCSRPAPQERAARGRYSKQSEAWQRGAPTSKEPEMAQELALGNFRLGRLIWLSQLVAARASRSCGFSLRWQQLDGDRRPGPRR